MPRQPKMDWDRVARDARAASRGIEPASADVDDLTPEERRELRRRVPPRLQSVVDRATSEMNTLTRSFARLEIPEQDQQYHEAARKLEQIARQARSALPDNAPPACHREITH